MPSKFALGQIVFTPAAQESFGMMFMMQCLERHAKGDWGDLDDEDKEANEMDLKEGGRLLSSYVRNGEKLWIITESDRSSTCILLPSDY